MSFSSGEPDSSNTSRAFEYLSPDQKIDGRFTLIEILGEGGMGVVWKAHDDILDTDVALKFLPPEIQSDELALDDLRQETTNNRCLSHKNIVRIHDFHTIPGTAFISMEYVEGGTARQYRLNQPSKVIPWSILQILARDLCHALICAHEEKIVHRDIKPSNLLITKDFRIKLSDFGLSRVMAESLSRRNSIEQPTGTLTYMSPQQLKGMGSQVSDDIYSVGATLYELLTGLPPFFEGDISHQIREENPEPMLQRLDRFEMENDVPAHVEDTIMACLNKDDKQRPESASELMDILSLPPEEEPSEEKEEEAAEIETDKKSSPEKKLSPSQSDLPIDTILWGGLSLVGLGLIASIFYVYPTAGIGLGIVALIISAIYGLTQISLTKNSITGHFINASGMEMVLLPRGYWVSKFLVTQETFKNVAGYNPSKFKSPRRPVEMVSWTEAMDFCDALTDLENQSGKLPTGYKYALPTDNQWDYFVGKADLHQAFTSLEKSRPSTADVGAFPPNQFGLHDVRGNVWEWCADWYNERIRAKDSSPMEFYMPAKYKVMRGGSWASNNAKDLDTACRSCSTPQSKTSSCGFRCVLVKNK